MASTSAHVIPTYGVTVGFTPYAHPVQSLYHAQDIHGQYVYGYATPTSTKTETKTADGVTRGGYSYIDSNGILQSVEYVADPIHGFRVAATNLPQDLPDVAYAKAKHLAEFEEIKNQHLAARTVHYSNPIAVPYSAVPQVAVLPVQDLPEVAAAKANHLAQYEAIKAEHLAHASRPPVQVQDLPEVVKARAEHLAAVEATKARNAAVASGNYYATNLSPVQVHTDSYVVPVHVPNVVAQPVIAAKQPIVAYAPIGHQYQSQDNYGQYAYGYAGPWGAKSETKTADGVVRGGYSYIDASGVLQNVHYTADAVHGFRVAGTNIPVGPESHVAHAPEPNHDAQKLYSHNVYY